MWWIWELGSSVNKGIRGRHPTKKKKKKPCHSTLETQDTEVLIRD